MGGVNCYLGAKSFVSYCNELAKQSCFRYRLQCMYVRNLLIEFVSRQKFFVFIPLATKGESNLESFNKYVL